MGEAVAYAYLSRRKRNRRGKAGGSDEECATSERTKLFQRLDSRRKGWLDERDIVAFARRAGLPERYVPQLMDEADKDGDGKVTPGEFERYEEKRDKALRRAFREMDMDRDGFISKNELATALKRAGVSCVWKHMHATESVPFHRCSDSIDELVAQVDVDGDSRVSFSEFRDAFALMPSLACAFDYWVDLSRSRQSRDVDCGCLLQVQPAQRVGHQSPVSHLISGCIGGAVSRSATAPLETVRVRKLAGMDKGKAMLGCLRGIVKSEGWRALFRGNMTNVLRFAPTKGIDFFAFEWFKRKLKDRFNQRGAEAQKMVSGALAGGCSTLLLYPLDVLRVRLTAGLTYQPSTVGELFASLTGIARREGVRALFSGLPFSLMAMVPEAALTYGSFDLLKEAWAKHISPQVGALPVTLCAVLAAGAGQTFSFPIEAVSRRLATNRYDGVASAARAITAEYGLRGFWAGLPAALVRVIPMAILSFGCYELTRWALSTLARELTEMKANLVCSGSHYH